MDQEQSFLEAIYAAPEDDAVRLVYADWLEEQGEAARAEFIRVQIEYARAAAADPDQDLCPAGAPFRYKDVGENPLYQRARQLQWKHGDKWLRPLHKFGVSAEHFHR